MHAHYHIASGIHEDPRDSVHLANTGSPQGDPPFAEMLEEPFKSILAFQPSELAADAGQLTVPKTARKPPEHTTALGATDRVKHLVEPNLFVDSQLW